ncbi:MAG: hypothetical protein ACRD1H_06395, partial [Vicinamibacterales bacterium]
MAPARTRCLAVATLFVGLACLGPHAQVAVQQRAPIDADVLLETVRTLSSAAFEGRRAGTPGNAKARAWIVERFREIGLAPPGDTFQMPFTFTRPAAGAGRR